MMPTCTCREDSEARYWPVLLASFVATSLTNGIASSMGVFYIEWNEEFPQSSALVGWLSSSMLALLLCSSPLSGALVNYFGVRRVVVAGGLLSFTGLLLASFAEEFYILFIAIPFMAGIGFGLVYTGVMVVISECFHEHHAMATGISMSGASVGMVILPIFFRFLIDQYGWQRALFVTSALHANVLVCAMVLRLPKHSNLRKVNRKSSVRRLSVSRRARYHSQSQASASSNQFKDAVCIDVINQDTRTISITNGNDGEGIVSIEQSRSPIGELEMRPTCLERVLEFLHHTGFSLFWTNRVFSSFIVSVLAGASIYGITLPYIAAHAKFVGIPEFEASLLVSIIGIGNLLSRPTHGRLLDANLTQPGYLYAAFVALTTIAALVIVSVQSYLWLVVSAVLIGLSAGAFIPMQAPIIRRIVGKERFPGGFGVGQVTVAVGNMFSAAIAGYMFDTTGSYSAGFILMSAVSGLCIVLLIATHLLWTRLVPDSRWPTVR